LRQRGVARHFCYLVVVKTTLHSVLKVATSLDGKNVDTLYGLEPVYEPGDALADEYDPAPFVTVQCPYCGESFETRFDLSAGSASYIEDCQVCCQPIELGVTVNAAGTLTALDIRRSD
jgi:hypothetical protein